MRWYDWLFLVVGALIGAGSIYFAFRPKTGQSK